MLTGISKYLDLFNYQTKLYIKSNFGYKNRFGTLNVYPVYSLKTVSSWQEIFGSARQERLTRDRITILTKLLPHVTLHITAYHCIKVFTHGKLNISSRSVSKKISLPWRVLLNYWGRLHSKPMGSFFTPIFCFAVTNKNRFWFLEAADCFFPSQFSHQGTPILTTPLMILHDWNFFPSERTKRYPKKEQPCEWEILLEQNWRIVQTARKFWKPSITRSLARWWILWWRSFLVEWRKTAENYENLRSL